MKESKNFIKIFFLTVGAFLLSISIFNYLVDPLSVFTESNNQSREYKLAQLLTNHPNVIATNMDERKFVKARVNIESIEFDPRIIVVGSSRVLQLGNNILKKNVLNFGVSGASLEDKIAILDITTSKFNPKLLIVGADPWIFNEASGQTRWQTLFDEYYSALANLELNSKVEIIKKKKNYEQLISLAYTKESLSYAYKKFLNNEDEDEDEYENVQYLDSDQPLPNKNIIRRDGTLVYNLKYANQNEDIKIRDSKKWANFSMNPYYFSNKRQEIFEAFLQRYKKDYEVIMFLTPYHPAAYYDFLLNDSVILEMEKKFRAIAKLHDIRILGSYNPEKYACKGPDFFDGAHPKVSCIDKVISLDGPL
jgi:hypothetical protein